MADRETAEEKLARLRELILNARAMPMSASCVINRGDVLSAIDDVIENLPDEIADAQHVIDRSQAKIAEGEAEAGRILAEAREHAATLAQHSEMVRVAEQQAAEIRADAEEEAAALRRETDEFIDSRMAGFESVLHKTASQVKTARLRLAERSELDGSGSDRASPSREPLAESPVCSLVPSTVPASKVVRRSRRRTASRLGRNAMSSPHRPLDPRSGLVLDTHELGRRAGAMKQLRTVVEAPAELGIDVIGVPPGSPVELDVRLESVVEGVLVTGTATVAVHGQCVRCLAEISDQSRGRRAGAVRAPGAARRTMTRPAGWRGPDRPRAAPAGRGGARSAVPAVVPGGLRRTCASDAART